MVGPIYVQIIHLQSPPLYVLIEIILRTPVGYALVLASTIFQYTSLDSIAFEIEEIVDITAAATILVVGFYKGYKSYVYNKATKEALDDPLKRSVLSETEYEERLKSIL